MDISRILDELRQERVQLGEAILSIERLALGRKTRRGGPPSWLALAKSAETTTKRRGRPLGSKNKNASDRSFTAAASGD
jgi:hypothetical protein